MLQAMFNGVSAILATQQDMDVIGNDIANVNTTAYKSSSVTFADQLSQTYQGASAATSTIGGTNPKQTGTGTKIGSIDTLMSQGGLLSTSSPTDMAIQGNGFFMVSSSSSGIAYTRDGHFTVDNTGHLVDATTGEYVLGWQADPTGKLDTSAAVTPASNIAINVGQDTAVHATTAVSYTGNLSADAAAGATYSRSVKVYDSLGESHTITLNFTRQTNSSTNQASNTWTWTANGDPGMPSPTGTTNQGTVTFDANGNLSAQTGSFELKPTNGSASPEAITADFSGTSQVTGESTLGPDNQDGYPAGTLQSFTVDQNGIVSGLFSNGLTRPLGQVALANFANAPGLSKIGNNEFAPTANSGQSLVGTANTVGLGTISTGYLEQSNVDLGTEFTDMIVAQRSFQANTKIVTTVDEMLDTLVQMKQS